MNGFSHLLDPLWFDFYAILDENEVYFYEKMNDYTENELKYAHPYLNYVLLDNNKV
jgi:hypothetical protein